MANISSELHLGLEAISRALQELHKQILEVEAPQIPGRQGLALLDRLINDPEWAWLRALSMLIADLDEAVAVPAELTPEIAAALSNACVPWCSVSAIRATSSSWSAIARCSRKVRRSRAHMAS